MNQEVEPAFPALSHFDKQTSALLKAARAIMKHTSFQEAAHEIFNCAKEATGATAGYVAMMTEDGTENEVLFLDAGGRACSVDPSLPMPIRGLRNLSCFSGEAVYENDFMNSEWAKFMPKGHVTLDNVLFSPLNVNGNTMGLIGLANKTGGFDDHDAQFVSTFGELAAIALVNSKNMEELERSRMKFRSVVDSAVDAIVIINGAGNIIYWNHAAEKVFGYSEKEVMNTSLAIIIPKRFRRAHQIGLKRILEGGPPRIIGKTMELSAVAKDGREFPIQLSLSSWKSGGELYFTSLIHDITERKKAENALADSMNLLEDRVRERTAELEAVNRELEREVLARKASEQAVRASARTYETILDTTMDGFMTVDSGGVIVDVNDSYCLMTGYSKEDLLGKSATMIEAQTSLQEIQRRLNGVRSQGSLRFETKHRKKNGDLIDIELSASFLPFNGGMYFGFIRDLTQRNIDEIERKKLSAAVEYTAESVVITGPDGYITYVNPMFEKMTGYSAKEAIGRKPSIMKSGKHDEGFYKKLWATIKSGKVWRGNIINRKKNGILYEGRTSISPILDVNGDVASYVAVARDISNESILKKARDHFTSITSHELQAPISNIQLIKALLRGHETASTTKDYMNNILDESLEGLRRIIDATTLMENLSISEVDKSFYLFYPYITLASSIEKAWNSIEKAERKLSIDLDLDHFPKEATIFGDQSLVLRAFDYVLSNAIKYTPDGKRIFITAFLADDMARFVFRDQGAGISKTRLNQLFEPYFSLQNPLNYNEGDFTFKGVGMGLGLALCRMIVDRHNGSISIESPGANQGASVTISFPLAEKVISSVEKQ